MKLQQLNWLYALAAAAGLATVAGPAQAGQVVINNFNNAAEATRWYWENWSAPAELSFDDTLDAGGDETGAGSLRVVNNFPDNPDGYSQSVVTIDLGGPVDAETLYSKVSLDVRLDPSSHPRANGVNYGVLEVVFRNGNDWTWNSLGGVALTSAEWVHLEFQVKAPGDKVHHLTLKLGENNLTNTVVYNVDNIRWDERGGEVPINHFDTATESRWYWENWSDPATTEWDGTQNAGGGADGSGSLRVSNNFPDRPNGYGQSVISLDLGGNVDAETLYSKVILDVKVDPSSALRSTGTGYGALEVIFRNGTDWTWNSLGAVQLTSTEWVHLEFPVKAPGDRVHHLTLKLGENNLTNTVIYNVDNIRWVESATQLPPPVMSIAAAKPGLNLTAGSAGQYDRQNIRTVGTSFGWVDAPEAVSYSVTIKDFPSAVANPGFQTHLYLVPGTPGTEASPDWNQPTVVYITMNADAAGGGNATFHYKTNAPNSNGPGGNGYFNTDPNNGFVGQLGSVHGASILGTWTFTFSENTKIALIAPDGTTTNVQMPAEDAALFAGDLVVWYGIMPTQVANIGLTAILGGASIASGGAVLVEDTFAEGLNPEIWRVQAQSAAAVVPVLGENPFWVYWTSPASGFRLQQNPGLGEADWTDSTGVAALMGTQWRLLVTDDARPSASAGNFRLLKP